MANIVKFSGVRYQIEGRTWRALDAAADAGTVSLLNDLTARRLNPGPQDGFTTVDRHLAFAMAKELGGEVVELDPVEIPPDPGDGRAY